MSDINFDKILEKHDLSPFRGLFNDAALSARLTFSRQKSSESPGFSRAGGTPHLPPGFQWPLGRSKQPLAFLCQIDLSQGALSICPELPDRGLLSFFYDAFNGPWGNDHEDKAGWKVFYFEDTALLKRTDSPQNLPAGSLISPCAISIREELSYPAITVEMAAVSDRGYDVFASYLEASAEIYGDRVIHRMFGNGQDIVGDFRLDCEIASRDLNLEDDFDFGTDEGAKLALASEQWLLLLQIDSDEKAQMMWVDEGRLFFAIKKKDLLARRFDQVWMICQTN